MAETAVENLQSGEILAPVFKELETILGKDTYDMWMRPASFELKDSVLTIQIPNPFWQKTIQNRYENIIKDAVLKHTGLEINIQYIVKENTENATENKTPATTTSTLPIQPVVRRNPFPSRLNSLYRFENFIEAPSNRFAYKLSQAAANKLGDRGHNPLFIYSTPGLGKTHLLHAIGNQILQNNPYAKVLYMSAEEFVAEYVQAIQYNSTDDFRRKYRSLDCLLMDDIQFVAGKSDKVSVQEFFHTFNALFDSSKQIILSSDRTPQQLDLDERLSSRLLSGPTCEIKKPYFEARIAILRQKRDANHFNIGDDVLAFIGEGIQTNIRELEGALFRLMSYCDMQGVTPTISIAKEILADILTLEERRLAVNINTIKKVVGKHFKINMEDFSSKRKTQSIAWPRQIAMYLANDLTDMSLPEIGREFNRDHSTVVHARDLVKETIKKDPFFAAEINQILSDIKAVDNK